MNEKIKAARQEWESGSLGKALSKFPERKPSFSTSGAVEIKRLYTPEDAESANALYMERLGFPGEYPYTRGVQPTMYRGRFWTMRQYAGFASAAESNKRYKLLLKRGQTGLSIAFDLPTQMGYDADARLAHGEVGKVGVSICSLKDMELLFDGIPLDQVSTSMTINSTAAILLAMYIAVAEKQGVERKSLRGTIQNDLLKEYIARGTYIYPPKQSMRIIMDLFAFCNEEVPKWNPISISGYHIREAGSTAAQEVGFTIADGIAYVQAAVDSGLNPDDFAGQLSFFFASHNNLLEEVSKFRAARRLWARIMKERFGCTNENAMRLRFHTQTCGCTLTAQQPYNNVVRVAYQALAAVLGGTQSLHTNSLDEALALPSEQSVTLALRTQQILAHESGVADSIDPLAGSYLIESMTDQIEADAERYINKIDEIGGAVAGIERAYQQREIQDAAYAEQRRIEAEEQIVVGVNKFKDEKPMQVPLQRVSAEVEASQVARLAQLRLERDQPTVERLLEKIRSAARDEERNLVPVILEAVKAYATIGEIADAMRDVFGTYDASAAI
jgi:methylmalonyl-CoA mutase N-terminal domain/subunit